MDIMGYFDMVIRHIKDILIISAKYKKFDSQV